MGDDKNKVATPPIYGAEVQDKFKKYNAECGCSSVLQFALVLYNDVRNSEFTACLGKHSNF